MNKFLYYAFCFFILATVFNINAFANTEYQIGKISSSSGVAQIYSHAGTTGHEAAAADKNKSKLLCTLTNGTEVRILGKELDGDGDMWYKITYGDNFENVGYAFNTRVSIIYDYVYDDDFEKNLENFPESYHDYLRALHAKYPNWKFVANNFDITFKTAVEAQYDVNDVTKTRKWVEHNYYGEEWIDPRAKNGEGGWLTPEPRWTYASRAAIEYYMDPRNSLDENKIFVFMQQSYQEDENLSDNLRTVVKGTFLEKGYDKNGDGTVESGAYIDDLIKAGKESGVSPYILAATIIVEQGTAGTSGLISGNYPGYEGYYNFYNFAASGPTTSEIIMSGLKYAKNSGWNSREAAIIGGAKKYADGYINVGQDTYYYKDFNVVTENWNHQYACSLYDAWVNASYLKKGCASNTSAPLIFSIPVYSDMPNIAAPLPTVQPSNPIGDINGDSNINNKDLGVLLQYLNGWNVAVNTDITDVNADGKINNKDYGLLMQYVNGWDVTLGAPHTTDAQV